MGNNKERNIMPWGMVPYRPVGVYSENQRARKRTRDKVPKGSHIRDTAVKDELRRQRIERSQIEFEEEVYLRSQRELALQQDALQHALQHDILEKIMPAQDVVVTPEGVKVRITIVDFTPPKNSS